MDTSDDPAKKRSKTPSAADVIWSPLIWFFDKDGERIRYEISRERTGARYRLVITHPDGSESVQEVDQPTELIERSVQLMNSLRGEGWHVSN